MQPMIRIILWVIAILSLVVAVVWYYNEPSFEPLLALLGGLPAILEMMVSSGGGNTSVENVESKQGGVSVEAKTGGDMKVKGVTAKTDVNIKNE